MAWSGRWGRQSFAASLCATVVLFATACGGSDHPGSASSKGDPTSSAVTSVVARTGGKLEGDEDDDDTVGADRSTGAAAARYDNDADADNDSKAAQNKGYRDSDDRQFVTWGRAADPDVQRAVVALVSHYYEFAAAGNGAAACGLIYVIFAEAIPEDYGQPPGPPALRGKTCAIVLSKLFKQEHSKIAADSASLKVTGVRVQRAQGRALLGFATAPAAYIGLHREGQTWKIVGLLATALP